MANEHRQLRDGFETAFINGAYSSNLAYRPQFLSNNYERGQKVLSSIEDELLRCEEFYISVAFITKSGITPLLQTFRELSNRGIKGKNSHYQLPEFYRSGSDGYTCGVKKHRTSYVHC